MSKLNTFEWNGHKLPISFIETQQVKDGVICDIYIFPEDNSKDLGIVTVSPGSKTPKQRVLTGDKTIEGFISGKGSLSVTTQDGELIVYKFPGEKTELELHINDIMQWSAETELCLYEICYPAYSDGRFQNLN